ncbi:MAG TPA: CAP family protein, partial [Kofleriaceae bacterium]|nr:CAP family protein [Kofleriaceae bacterium]
PPRTPSAASSGAPPTMAALVERHNVVRAKHCAGPLTWSPKLAQAAQAWAKSLEAQGCKFGHSPRNPYGENLAAGTSGTLDGEAVTNMWYDEVKLYKFPSGGFSMQTGHFTQVVWRQTTQIGCGVTTCNGMDIFVCEYDPPGNVDTMYRQNVLPAGCKR